jgi:hypothetical protein
MSAILCSNIPFWISHPPFLSFLFLLFVLLEGIIALASFFVDDACVFKGRQTLGYLEKKKS